MKKCKSYQNVAKNLGKKDIYQKFSKKIEIITKNLGLIRPRGEIAYSKGLRLTPPPCSPMLKIPCLLFPLQRVFFRSHEGREWPQKAVFHQVRRRSRVSDRR